MLTKKRVSHSNKNISISSISWGKCFFYAFLTTFLFATSCKNPDNIGLDVIPASDHLSTLYTDTVTITSMTVREDSLRSDEVSQILLGSISDADFGISTASIYTQILLGQTPSLGSGALTADSLVLSFGYSTYYGDTSTPINLHVYRLNQDLYLDSSYYTSRYFSADSTNDLAITNQYTLHPSDSSTVGNSNQPLQLRIRLLQSLADSLVSANVISSYYTSNDAWKSYFKGFYIKVDPVIGTNVGSILYLSPTSAYTKMTLYYHDDTLAKSYDFSFSSAARVNHQIHDYSITSSAGHQLNDASFNDSLTYIQSLAGLKAHISFPYFKHIIDSGRILINKAELLITVPEGTDTPYSAPSNLFLTARDSSGGLTFVTDYLDQLISFGGIYAPTTNTYKFNIGRHLQRILDGDINDYGFSLNIVSSVVQANRVIIGSGKGTANPAKMKLNLFYTKL
jgi:hypothetical protein